MDISEHLGSVTTTQEEVEPFLEVAPALVEQRRSQSRIIWDRFIRNRAAVVGAAGVDPVLLPWPLSLDAQSRFDQCAEHLCDVGESYAGTSFWYR